MQGVELENLLTLLLGWLGLAGQGASKGYSSVGFISRGGRGSTFSLMRCPLTKFNFTGEKQAAEVMAGLCFQLHKNA